MITDEQIRELREEAWRVYAAACYALGRHPMTGLVVDEAERDRARAECAEILNARAKEGK